MSEQIYPISNEYNLPDKHINSYGIDLGTTYTLMATVDSSHVNLKESNRIPVKFINIEQESPNIYDSTIVDEKVASIVALVDGKPYVGNNLYHLKGSLGFEYKKNMFYNWKVEMGIDQCPMYPEAVSEKLNMPYKIAGGILNYCRLKHIKDPAKVMENTIITVPASFQVNQRKDTIKAAEFSKIKTSQQMLIDEPNAAFLGYFNRLSEGEKQKWASHVKNKNVLIIDFGGGTCDLSILNVDFIQDKGITIGNKAISRYNDLGGQDIDMVIAEELLYPKFLDQHQLDDQFEIADVQNVILPQLAVYGEQLKIDLCDKLNLKSADKDVETLDLESVSIKLEDCKVEFCSTEYRIEDVGITGSDFKKMFTKMFRGKHYNFKYQDKSITTVSHSISEIIEKSDLTLDDIQFVLYVGGSSFNPFLISMVKEKLSNSISLVSSEPDKLVAEGAAVFSYFYYYHGLSLISPITSDTIGIKLKGNRFHPIIEKGHSLPIKVELPDFKIQSNLTNEIVIPVCVNGVDFSIGEIRCPLNDFYSMEDVVRIESGITADKIFDIKVFINEEFIGEADFDNPFAIGNVTEEELEVLKLQSQMNKARQKGSRAEEKRILHDLIWKHSDAGNKQGSLQCAEEYIKRFDDQDAYVWNMVYCNNSSLGRVKAAKKGLERAVELAPMDTTFIYNYSLLLARDSEEEALDYLINQEEGIRNDEGIRCKIVLLKKECDMECLEEARGIIEHYKSKPYYYSDFDKRILLPGVFRIANEPYSYADPKGTKRRDDEKKFLDTKNQITKNI
ncbi:Hsp70 family protein [Saccharicrinis sp. GN24d3]|uniref:Hsp70 family protein n=1 Tax=Saccharicrinis sp. GN24d3 TaxID=3458416 RepID=UPI004035DFBC